MIEKKTSYTFNVEEKTIVKNFTVLKGGKQVAGGFVSISDNELLNLYETEPELAMKDPRLHGLLEPSEPVEPEPTQLDRIESAINKTQAEIAQEARDAYTLELINSGII